MEKILINAHKYPDFVDEKYLENGDGLSDFFNTYLIELDDNKNNIEDINIECFNITVYEITNEFTLDDNYENGYYWKVIKTNKVLDIWNTEYDNRGIKFYDDSYIQSELVFYLGNLCDKLKEYIINKQ